MLLSTRERFKSFYYETVKLPEIKLDPKKTALLIVDLQNEFVLRDFGEALEFKEMGNGTGGFLFMTGWMIS